MVHHSVAASIAIILWSVSALRNGGFRQGVAIYGCIISALIILGIVVSHLRLDVHGMTAVWLGQSIWLIFVDASCGLGRQAVYCRNRTKLSPFHGEHKETSSASGWRAHRSATSMVPGQAKANSETTSPQTFHPDKWGEAEHVFTGTGGSSCSFSWGNSQKPPLSEPGQSRLHVWSRRWIAGSTCHESRFAQDADPGASPADWRR